MKWVKIAEAAKKFKVDRQKINAVRLSENLPKWMEKRGREWWVDIQDKDLATYLKVKMPKAIGNTIAAGKKKLLKKKIAAKSLDKSKEPHDKKEILSLEDTEKLQDMALEASLEIPLVKLQSDKLGVEEKRLKLKQKTANLISRELAEFLYLGYLDRLNREVLQVHNRVAPGIDLLIAEVIFLSKSDIDKDPESKMYTNKITSMVVKYLEEIIRNVKAAQVLTIEQWAKEEGLEIEQSK